MEQVKNATLYTAIEIFKMNNRLLNNVIQDVHQEDASKRFGEANHFSWILGHIIETRAELCAMVGNPISYSFSEFFKEHKGMDPGTEYPTLHLLTEEWPQVAETSITSLMELSEEELFSPVDIDLPLGNKDMISAITFLAQHESYHLGQLGLLRRELGYEPMQYA